VGGYAPRAREEIVRPRRLVHASGRPLNFSVRSRYGPIWLLTRFNRSRAAPAHLPAACELLPRVTCNRSRGACISVDVSVDILSSGFRLDRGRVLTDRTCHPLATGVVGPCIRQDQMSIVRCSVYIKIPSVGSEDLPELWV